MTTRIAITDTEAHFANYPRWILSGQEDIEVVHLTPENVEELERCQGLVLSGGVDTHPRFYSNHTLIYPHAPTRFDEIRDRFELAVFGQACERQLPVLAICRGMQLINVALGGDVIQDLEAEGKRNHRKQGATDGIHDITIVRNSLLFEITGTEIGRVNSAHHQAVDRIAADLMATAFSEDGVVEGLEWKEKETKSFLLGVQWHPERLDALTPGNPLGQGIRKRFLEAIWSKGL